MTISLKARRASRGEIRSHDGAVVIVVTDPIASMKSVVTMRRFGGGFGLASRLAEVALVCGAFRFGGFRGCLAQYVLLMVRRAFMNRSVCSINDLACFYELLSMFY